MPSGCSPALRAGGAAHGVGQRREALGRDRAARTTGTRRTCRRRCARRGPTRSAPARARPSPRGPRRGSREGAGSRSVERVVEPRALDRQPVPLRLELPADSRDIHRRKGSRASAADRTPPPPRATFGRSRTRASDGRRAPSTSSRIRRVTRSDRSRARRSKSRIVQRWMFGVSYQACGSVRETGIRPRSAQVDAVRPVAEVAERDDARRGPTRTISRQHHATAGAWPAGVCDSTTTSNDASSKSDERRSSMSACTTGTPRATQAKNPSSDASMPLTAQPRSAARCASSAPSPRAEVEHARARAARAPTTIARSVRSADLRRHAVEEGGHRAVVLRHLEQERVVAVRGGDLAER